MPLQLEAIGGSNVESVVGLLLDRNQTLPEYTRWKYSTGPEGFRGVVARQHGVAVGCFGVVPRVLLAGTESVRCGWFADWFVSPTAQGAGIGSRMLEAIMEELPVVFGHPAPAKARRLCLRKGFEPLPFSSRRRLVLQRLVYELRRTRYGWPVALPRSLKGLWRSCVGKRSATEEADLFTQEPPSHFDDVDAFGKWIVSQPVRPDVQRKRGRWAGDALQVQYADDVFQNGEIRRRILHSEGAGCAEACAWQGFVEDAMNHRCTYVDLFTTDEALDQAWAALGAWRYPDAPVLVAWKGIRSTSVLLHGWDRESWTLLADGQQQAVNG